MTVLSLSKLKAFQLAGMTGSFKHAAHLLAVSPSTVSARVRSLESDLGIRLFQRGIRKLTLTDAGASYIHEVVATFVGLDMATRDLRNRFGSPARAQAQNAESPAGLLEPARSPFEHGRLDENQS